MDTVDTRSASVPEDGEKIIEIQLERLRTFKNHPFKIRMHWCRKWSTSEMDAGSHTDQIRK